MRVLVTGGCGFIGSNLIHHLLHTRAGADAACCPDTALYDAPHDLPDLRILNLDKLTYAGNPQNLAGVEQNPRYTFVQADVADPDAIDHAVRDFKPDLVLHLAAESHVDRSIESGDAFVRTNVLGTQVLLDAVRRHDVPRILHVSTDEVYGSIPEGQYATEEWPLKPSSPYSASKAAADLLCLAHHRTYGTNVVVTRCTNNYGPRQHEEKLVPKALKCIERGEQVPLYGDGLHVRDWLYVKDHCTAIEAVARRGGAGRVYNVAGRNLLTNRDLVARLGGTARQAEDRLGHDRRYAVDDSLLRQAGWAPRHTVMAVQAAAVAASPR